MKVMVAFLLALAFSISLTACSDGTVISPHATSASKSDNGSEERAGTISVEYDSDDLDYSINSADISYIPR